ncbi:MAG: efflux RND transporter permease subunit [Phycisphaeraceae bacterium]|nr:efflux RND transporter permease subunit [Phycisphaeraceae bacterium]
MLRHLIAFSIHHASVVLLLAGALLAWAVVRLPEMPVDVFPELNAPTVVLLTEAPGLAADEVEQAVTVPIEASMLGLPGVRRVRSASAPSLGLIWVEFGWGEDILRARQFVTERLTAIRDALPPGAHAEMTPITSITGEIMLLAVSSPDGTVSDLELRAWSEFDLRRLLLAVPGVAQVSVIGGELPEYQVNLDPERLGLMGLSVDDIVSAAAAAHDTSSAGFLRDVDRRELPIRQSARVTSARDLADTLVERRGGTPVRLGEVAEVRLGPAPQRGTAASQGRPAVVLSVQKSPGTNTLALTRSVDRALDRLMAAAPKGVVLERRVFRQSDFIERSVSNLMKVLRDAVIIVSVVLVLFLLNVRTTLITLAALPLSLAAALLVMDGMGLTLNVMTLGGLAVAVGVLVDDAIIDVENVYRRLRENAGRAEADRLSTAQVVLQASNEIRPAMVMATVIIVVVFAPLFALEGVEGRFFRPLGITYVVSIVASLLVALTVTPAACSLFLGGLVKRGARMGSASRSHGDGWVVARLKRLYEPSLRWSLRHRFWVVAGAIVMTLMSLMTAARFGTSFLPSFNEGSLTVFVSAPPGTSLDETDRAARMVEQRLLGIDGVATVTRRTGRAERDEHAEPVFNSEIDIALLPDANVNVVRRAVAEVITDVPGLSVQIGQPIEHRLSHILSGTPAAIAINVYGEDLPTLRELARSIEGALKPMPGARDVTANREMLIPSLSIRFRRADLAAAGLTPASAARQVQSALHGARVAEVTDGHRRLAITVRLAEGERQTIQQVRDLLLRNDRGAMVRLNEIADIDPEMTSGAITREGGRRKAVVSLNVSDGHNLGDLVEEVRQVVDPIVHARGATVEYGGQFEARESAAKRLLLGGLAVLLVMVVLLRIATGSTAVALLVMVNLPLGLIGGIAAIIVAESILGTSGAGPLATSAALLGLSSAPVPVISIASMVGFITLFGIALRNGLLLVNHYRHLAVVEHCPPAEVILRGSLERLSPILMTALSAALGLLPLALAAGRPGSELLAPMAIVVLGGLMSSTLLNLVVVPVGYALVRRVPREAFVRR